MNRSQLLLILYVLFSILEITGDVLESQILIYLTKPLLMPLLIGWFLSITKEKSSRFKKILVASLVFAFLGDTFLMLLPYNELFFLLGLGSFLIGQLMYGWAFILNIKHAVSKGDVRINILFSIMFGAFYYVLMHELFPKLGEFLIPVLIYGLAICFMGLTAAFRYQKVSMASYFYVLGGALVFVVSDTCIALDKFYFEGGFPYAQAVIMITYCSAQYLLVHGSALYIQKN